tara:strand:+ start:234 stop:614 length:381 start_codon:yes stop_codon:yes gene_type:complete
MKEDPRRLRPTIKLLIAAAIFCAGALSGIVGQETLIEADLRVVSLRLVHSGEATFLACALGQEKEWTCGPGTSIDKPTPEILRITVAWGQTFRGQIEAAKRRIVLKALKECRDNNVEGGYYSPEDL